MFMDTPAETGLSTQKVAVLRQLQITGSSELGTFPADGRKCWLLDVPKESLSRPGLTGA
jgi:hypothetical protein